MENSKIIDDDPHFKEMKLYYNPQRIYKQLQQAGYDSGKLSIELLSKFDNYHYYGTQAIDECVNKLQISKNFRVLDFGSGLGGPARHIANKTHCHVTAVEIQKELNEIASDLTNRCGLSDRVHHVRQNICDFEIESNHFDCTISWLAVNHIDDKVCIFKKLLNMLKKGGKIYIEDFYQMGTFTEEEREVLFIENLPTLEDYRQCLADAGFINTDLTEVTVSWKKFVHNRTDNFVNQLPQNIAMMGERTTKSLLAFYKGMQNLYDTDTIGGVKIVAQRPEH